MIKDRERLAIAHSKISLGLKRNICNETTVQYYTFMKHAFVYNIGNMLFVTTILLIVWLHLDNILN